MTGPITQYSSASTPIKKSLAPLPNSEKEQDEPLILGNLSPAGLNPRLPIELLIQISEEIKNDEKALKAWIAAFITPAQQYLDKENPLTINLRSLFLLQKWLPASLQELALLQGKDLRQAAITLPMRKTQNTTLQQVKMLFSRAQKSSAPLSTSTVSSLRINKALIERYIWVLPHLQNFAEFQQLLDNLSLQLTFSDKVAPTVEEKLFIDWVKQKFAENLAAIPLQFWYKTVNLCLTSTEKTSDTAPNDLWSFILELTNKLAVCDKTVASNTADALNEITAPSPISLIDVLLGISRRYLSEDWQKHLPQISVSALLELFNKYLPNLSDKDFFSLAIELIQGFFPKLANNRDKTDEIDLRQPLPQSLFYFMKAQSQNLSEEKANLLFIKIAENLSYWPGNIQYEFYVELEERIEKLMAIENYSLLILAIQNFQNWPSAIQGKFYVKLIKVWLYSNTAELLLAAIKFSRNWHSDFIIARGFFNSIKNRFLSELPVESLQPILIALIHELPYWEKLLLGWGGTAPYRIKKAITSALQEQLSRIRISNSRLIENNVLKVALESQPDILPSLHQASLE